MLFKKDSIFRYGSQARSLIRKIRMYVLLTGFQVIHASASKITSGKIFVWSEKSSWDIKYFEIVKSNRNGSKIVQSTISLAGMQVSICVLPHEEWGYSQPCHLSLEAEAGEDRRLCLHFDNAEAKWKAEFASIGFKNPEPSIIEAYKTHEKRYPIPLSLLGVRWECKVSHQKRPKWKCIECNPTNQTYFPDYCYPLKCPRCEKQVRLIGQRRRRLIEYLADEIAALPDKRK